MARALTSIHHKFSQLSKAQTQRSIYRVHCHLRNVSSKAYERQIAAIGPYHQGKDNLKMMEEYKLRYLELLLRRRNQNVETYISAIGQMEQEARNCYAESISLNSAQFIEMLVLDGCFIIELIRKCNGRDSTCKDDHIPFFKWSGLSMPATRSDIVRKSDSFFVLCKLFGLIEAPNQHNRLIYLVLFFFQSLYPGTVYENRTDRNSNEVKHLLDLIHTNWGPTSNDHVYINVEAVPLERESRFIHSTTELTDANVEFEMRKSKSVCDVEFKKGLRLMPPITTEDRTDCFLRNLIAYEQYFPNNRPTFVTDYAKLMDCLINSSRDVEILSRCGFIDNWIGDNEVVADIFNQLTDSVTGHGKLFVYAETFRRINTHYKKRQNRAIAILNRDYFASPWAYISFFAALVLLLLSAAQTVFSALQVVKPK